MVVLVVIKNIKVRLFSEIMKKIVTAFSVKFLLIFSIFNKKNYTFAVINISNYVNIYYICAKTRTQ